MELNLDMERFHFEEYVRKLYPDALAVQRWPNGDYRHRDVESCWLGWLAAKRHVADIEINMPYRGEE